MAKKKAPKKDDDTAEMEAAQDVYDHIAAECDGGKVKMTAGPRPVAGVLRGLAGTGLSFIEVVKWLPVILQLIQTIGPTVQQIIDIIKAAIDGGEDAGDVRRVTDPPPVRTTPGE
jgi:hypothetical protein